MSQEYLGKCNECGNAEGDEHQYSCSGYIHPACPECGCDIKYLEEVEGCYDHLPLDESLYDYAKEKREEITRLRWMIDYASNAPDKESMQSILKDALDDVNGAENIKEVQGEREKLQIKLDKVTADNGDCENVLREIDAARMVVQGHAYHLKSKLDKVTEENKRAAVTINAYVAVVDGLHMDIDKVTAKRKALALSCKNIIQGGVDALKQARQEVDRLNAANEALRAGFNNQIDSTNRILAESYGIKQEDEK